MLMGKELAMPQACAPRNPPVCWADATAWDRGRGDSAPLRGDPPQPWAPNMGVSPGEPMETL